jgi:hypothetical protein
MKFLAIERDVPGVKTEVMRPRLEAEARRAWELYQAGVFRELYFDPDRHAAVLMLECANREDAQAALNSLPLVADKLITFELIPLVPYSGFARLFIPSLTIVQEDAR